MATQDEVCPSYVGERWIVLQQADALEVPTVLEPLELRITSPRCDAAGGLVLPLELVITGPRSVALQRFLFTLPRSVMVTPREAGVHVVLLREMAHNRWTGTMRFTAQGARDQ